MDGLALTRAARRALMQVLQRHLGGQGRYHLLRRIERDQRQVEKATREDNRYLQVRRQCYLPVPC
jgi:hypothetical protein